MQIFNIPENHVKNFMNVLLKSEIFDTFEARRVEIHNVASFVIESETKNLWATLRPFALHIVKDGGKPTLLKVVLSHTAPETLHPNAAALFLNLAYDNGAITCTSATSQKEFALNKDLDHFWDDWVTDFFHKRGVIITCVQA